jgi:hypothetical protein
MNRITALLLFISVSITSASELELKTAFLPLYVQHAVVNEGTEAVHTRPREVNFISRGAEPETTLHLLNSAFIPSHDTTWHEAKQVTDTNLVSLCSIQISHTARRLDGGGHKLEITVDTSLFTLPDTVTLSKEMTIDLVRKAIALNFPHAEIIIKDGEQAGTGQPATRPESKSEGSDKPQPEAEGRSR